MSISNFIEKNAAPIGIIATAVIFGAAAICTRKALIKAEKINNETEKKVENDSEIEEKNEVTVKKTKALIPTLGIIALSAVGTKKLGNGNIFLAGLTGSLAGAVYTVIKSPYEDYEAKKLTLKAGIIFSIFGTAIAFPILNGTRYLINHKEETI